MHFVWAADYDVCSIFSHLGVGRKDVSSLDCLWYRFAFIPIALYGAVPLIVSLMPGK